MAAARALADRREGLARLSGEVAAARSRVSAGQAEIERLALAAGEAADRAEVAAERLADRRAQLAGDEDGDVALVAAARGRRRRARRGGPAGRRADRGRAGRRAGPGLLAGPPRRPRPGTHPGRRRGRRARAPAWPASSGPVADRLTVQPGAEFAITAALGGMADAVVVSGVAEAAAALAHLKDSDGGRAGLLVTGGLPPVPRDGWPTLPDGVRWALDLVEAPADLQPALARALERVAVVPDLDAAVALVRTHPRVRAVTAAGDLVGADWAVGGQSEAPSNLVVRARVDEAEEELAAAAARAAIAGRRARRRPRGGRPLRSAEVDAALAARQAADRGRSAVAARARRARVRRRGRPPPRPSGTSPPGCGPSRRSSRSQAVAVRAGAAAGRGRGRAGRGGALDGGARPAARRGRGGPAGGDRGAARRPHRRGAGPRAARPGRVAAPPGPPGARRPGAGGRGPRGSRSAGRPSPRGVRSDAETALAALATSLTRAAVERDAAASARSASEAELLEVRARVRAATAELDRLTDEVHRDEVARAEQRYRIEALEVRAAEEYGVDLPTLLAEYGPAAPVPPTPEQVAAAEAAGEPEPDPVPYDRAVQERRAAQGRARPRHPRQGQPAGAGGVRGAGGAARLPRHPARGPQVHPARPAHRRPRGRRAHPRRLRGRLRRRRSGSSSRSSPRCSRAGTASWSSPSPTTCWPPASRSRRGRRARRSSGCRCCPAASAR